MRTVPFEFQGRELHLLLNGAALFDIYDQFGPEAPVMDHVQGSTREAFEALCWYVEELAVQGELWRRYQGLDKGALPDSESLRVCLSPLDVSRARRAVLDAICAGFERTEEPERGEVDKGLLELEKKTGADSRELST